jgi:hypothetical protein
MLLFSAENSTFMYLKNGFYVEENRFRCFVFDISMSDIVEISATTIFNTK